jgi:hypothetical protein
MAYIGKQPTVGNFVKLDSITTSATTTFNLLNGGVSYSPQSANHCIVSLNGVIQSPNTSFTISGSTIVFASALTATDVIDFILVLGDVLNIGTPSDATVGFSKVTSNLITGATAETSIAGGDSILIYDDSATALRKMTVANLGNTPAFSVYRSTTQSLSDNVATKIQFNTEVFDTDNAFDSTTNYRFTVPSGKGGKYFISLSMSARSTTGIDQMFGKLYKNGSLLYQNYVDVGSTTQEFTSVISVIVELAATDYIEGFVHLDAEPAGTYTLTITDRETNFNGFRLIGV